MSALNPIIFTLKNPEQPKKEPKELCLSEKTESILEIPSHLLQRAIQTCETKTEMIVYVTILRFSLGFNRTRCTLSRRFIATWTGLLYQNVGRGIEGLIAKGLIEKLSESNLKHGDVFKILHVTEAPMMRNQNDYARMPQCNQVENTQGVIRMITECNQVDYEASSERLRSVINPITKNKKEDLEESSSVSENLQKHIGSLGEAHCRRVEKRGLSQLLENFSCAQIELALEFALKRGTNSGERLKLPLSYLATGSSMENILALAEKQHQEHERKAHIHLITEQSRASEQEREKQNRERDSLALAAFESAFSTTDQQEHYIANYLAQSFKGFRPSGKIARSLAALHWHKSQQQTK